MLGPQGDVIVSKGGAPSCYGDVPVPPKATTDAPTVGSMLKQARRRLNLTQYDFARLLGANDRRSVVRWENDECLPMHDYRMALATVLANLDADEMAPLAAALQIPPFGKKKSAPAVGAGAAMVQMAAAQQAPTSYPTSREAQLRALDAAVRAAADHLDVPASRV